jgi:hypothetical protein
MAMLKREREKITHVNSVKRAACAIYITTNPNLNLVWGYTNIFLFAIPIQICLQILKEKLYEANGWAKQSIH